MNYGLRAGSTAELIATLVFWRANFSRVHIDGENTAGETL
jgi:hypothetical protein